MNWEYIYNEQLQGVIDWVNKEFTTLYDIERIEEVYYLWAAYRAVSFVGNTVTFVDAPLSWTTAPTIDYFKAGIATPTELWNVTLWEIIDDVYDKIGQNRLNWAVSNKVYKETQIKQHINNWFNRIKNLRLYKDVISQYSFNKAKDANAIGYNAWYVNIWTIPYIPSSWVFLLNKDTLISYSSYVDWKLNWAVWVVYENWAEVSIGYKIPTWIKKISEVAINWEVLPYLDLREHSIGKYWYTIYQTSNWDRYIILPYSDTSIVTVKYQAEYTSYVDDADVVWIEREYFEVLSYYALTQILKYREDDRWQIADLDYKQLLKEYKSYKSRAVDWINNEIKSDILPNF